MSTDTKTFTTSELKDIAHEVRAERDTIVGKCWEICHDIGNILIDRGLSNRTHPYEVYEVRVGQQGEENHFVMELDGAVVTDTTAQQVIVDASLDQFCRENQNKGLVKVALGQRSELQPVYVRQQPVSDIDLYMTVDEYLQKQLSAI